MAGPSALGSSIGYGYNVALMFSHETCILRLYLDAMVYEQHLKAFIHKLFVKTLKL
jgi:hypothetical protein